MYKTIFFLKNESLLIRNYYNGDYFLKPIYNNDNNNLSQE
jgi:hypothetical protein